MKKNNNKNWSPLVVVVTLLLVVFTYATLSNSAIASARTPSQQNMNGMMANMQDMMGNMNDMHGECMNMMGNTDMDEMMQSMMGGKAGSSMAKPEGMSKGEHESHHRQ